MSGGSTVNHIDAVDALARTLYLRAKQSGLPFSHVAASVRTLHLALRHLRIEAADNDSLLNSPSASLYARQLSPLVEDCDFTLAQLESLLDKYGDGKAVMADEERTRDQRLDVMQQKLAADKSSVELFLDAVQLHAENRPRTVVDGEKGLESIKDKVDKIATRIFRDRDTGSFTENEDELWQEFKTELEKEGFSPQVLRKHKDVLRAYIRELESVQSQYGGNYPTVRGLLEHEAKSNPTSPTGPPNDYQRFPPVIVNGRRRRSSGSDHRDDISTSPRSSDDSVSDYSMALVSTKDLIAMDSLNSQMSHMGIQPDLQQYSLSGQRHLSHNGADMSTSPASYYGASPRNMPPPGISYGASPRSSAPRLAPDRWGQEIPAEAEWTKIKRTLVSPEVLERAGVRYEARPEYVAILGRLSREQINDYARQSADCRAARSFRRSAPRRQERADSKSSRDEDDDSLFDDTDVTDNNDDKDSDKGTKSYPVIVHPPGKNKTSPSSTVLPKPILKNKNENHVHFDPEPHEVSSHSLRDDDRRRRDRDSNKRRSRRHSDAGERERYHRDHDRNRDRDRDRDRERDRDFQSSGKRYRDRDRRSSRSDRDKPSGRSKWGETLGAVGIGGAAVSLLSVLAEAAS